MPVCDYNCTTLPAHEKVQCGDFPKGGQNSIAILECDHTIIDFSDPTQWQTAQAAGDVKIIEPVRGIFPEPSEVTGVNPNACGAQEILDGFDAQFTWQDFNVTDSNNDFYNSLNERTTFLVWYECQNDRIRVVELATTFIAKLSSPESNREKQFYAVMAQWSTGANNGIPPQFSAPAGIFAQ